MSSQDTMTISDHREHDLLGERDVLSTPVGIKGRPCMTRRPPVLSRSRSRQNGSARFSMAVRLG